MCKEYWRDGESVRETDVIENIRHFKELIQLVLCVEDVEQARSIYTTVR